MPGGAYPPPEVVASWPKPNYINPETRGPALTITCTTLSVIGAIVVAARLYARLVITKAPGLDDAIIVVALLLGIGSSIIFIYSTEVLYIGHHAWDIPLTVFSGIRLNSWLGQWFITAMLSAVKISLLLFYRRLSVTFSSRFLWATWIGIVYNIVCIVVAAFTIGLECRPTAAYWLSFDLKWLAEGHAYSCAHIEGIILPVYSALSVVGDFYSTTLPLCLVYSLQMSSRQKTSLYCLFALGYLVVVAGIARTVFVNYVVNETYDQTWRYYDAMLWVTVEFYLALICASAPALKPFVKKFLVEPVTQDSSSKNRRRSGHTFASSGRKYFRNPGDTCLNDSNNDEESCTRGGVAVELDPVETENKRDKIGVTVHEMNDFFNDRPRHSLISNENGAGIEQYSRSPFPNIDRHSNTSDEPILEPLQMLENRAYVHPGQIVPFSLHIPPNPPTPPPVPSSRASRDPSFVTISAFPVPQPRALSRPSEAEERGTHDGDQEFELPLQGTREKLPVDTRPIRLMGHHTRSKSKAS